MIPWILTTFHLIFLVLNQVYVTELVRNNTTVSDWESNWNLLLWKEAYYNAKRLPSTKNLNLTENIVFSHEFTFFVSLLLLTRHFVKSCFACLFRLVSWWYKSHLNITLIVLPFDVWMLWHNQHSWITFHSMHSNYQQVLDFQTCFDNLLHIEIKGLMPRSDLLGVSRHVQISCWDNGPSYSVLPWGPKFRSIPPSPPGCLKQDIALRITISGNFAVSFTSYRNNFSLLSARIYCLNFIQTM